MRSSRFQRLNYDVFVREVGQYEDDGSGLLVDKFHDKNCYLVAVADSEIVGMVALHDQPPFSVAAKLADPNVLDELSGKLLEVRLLAIRPEWRHTRVFLDIVTAVYAYAVKGKYTHLLISGIVERQPLYERLCFRPLGPAVQSGEAWFMPMALDLRNVPLSAIPMKARLDRLRR